MLDAAVAAGIENVIEVSALVVAEPAASQDLHARVEEHMSDLSIGFRCLGPVRSAALLATSARAIKVGGGGGAAGAGGVNLIDTRDVADAAARLL